MFSEKNLSALTALSSEQFRHYARFHHYNIIRLLTSVYIISHRVDLVPKACKEMLEVGSF